MNQHRAHFKPFKSWNCFKVLQVPRSVNHLQQGRAFLTFHSAYTAHKWGLLQPFSLPKNVWMQKKEHWTKSQEARAPAPALAVTNSSCYFLVCEIKALSLKSTIGTFAYWRFLDYFYYKHCQKKIESIHRCEIQHCVSHWVQTETQAFLDHWWL